MRILLIFIIILAASFKLKAAEELDNINLILPISYEDTSSSTQTIKSKIKVEIGSLINIDLKKKVATQVAPFAKDLNPYFSAPNELDNFIDKIVTTGKDTIIGSNLTDSKLILFYQHLGNKLVGGIGDKILNLKGVKDPGRRSLWLKKILDPFNTCISKSNNSQYDAGHCMSALTSSLVPNLGLSLVYELTRTNLNSTLPENKRAAFDTEQVNIYKECVNKTPLQSNDVNTCALQTMRSGIIKVIDDKFSGVINNSSSSKEKANSIKKIVWPLFNSCTNEAQKLDQFMTCFDNLIKLTGEQLVKDKIITNPSVTLLFPPEEVTKLAEEKVQKFEQCIDKQKRDNKRKNGMLDSDTCANGITNDVAYLVAKESVRRKAMENKLSDSDTDQLIKLYVDQNFMSCLKAIPGTENLNNCSGKLKTNIATNLATNKIRLSASGKMSQEETEAMIDKLVAQNFTACLGKAPTDEKLNECATSLTKEATKTIVIAYEKKQLKEQLDANFTPDLVKTVEDNFVACVDQVYPHETLSKNLDECTKQYSLGFARTLGELKINFLMKTVLGLEGFNKQKNDIDDELLSKYNKCLDDLKDIDMQNGLLQKLTVCTNGLQQNTTRFIAEAVNIWMDSDKKDALTLLIKNDFAGFVPCLGSLLPPTPYTEEIQKNVASILKPMALVISNYIEYSPEDAKRTLDQIINKLSHDLRDVSSNPKSQQELIDLLYANGALDQFLKSMVQSQVKTSLEHVPESELPKNIRSILLEKENYDKIFATEEGKTVKDLVMEKILKPMLMNQESLKSPKMIAAMDFTKDKIIKMLVNSPSFGDQIIKDSIQNQINNMGGFTHFMAKILYGRNALDWEKVRTTSYGKSAEDYIREHLLLPKFKGEVISKSEEKDIMNEAEKLVKTAVKKYDDLL